MRKRSLTCAGVVLVIAACSSANGPSGDPDDPGGLPSGDWECAANDGVTQCERAGTADRRNYTCSSGDADCPPTGAAEGDDWACIAEETETHCREVVADETMASLMPTDCAIPSWKTHFCQLVDAELTSRGIDYSVRCDLLADQLQLSPLRSDACTELVDQLELESWTEAAYAGCTAPLSQVITAWCYNTNLQLSEAAVCD